MNRNHLAVALFLVAGLAACGETNPADATGNAQGITVDVQPPEAQTLPGGSVAFLGAVTGTVDTTVIWEVVDAGGGTIDASGRYTAPTSVGQYHVRAVSKADPTVHGLATVAVVLVPSVAVSVSPASSSVATGGSLTFRASVTGSSDTSVSWVVQETSGCGAISSTGVYTAPGTASTCHVVATSRADATKSAAATVTVTAAPPSPPPPAPSGPLPACATAPPRATGTVYYYCDCATGAGAGCTAGNDANAGTDPSSPRRTFANARSRFNGMNAGDTVALCRSGAWDENGGGINNPRCTAGNTCDFRDYVPSWGNASSPRPRLNTTSGRVFTMETAGHDEGYRYWNLDIRQRANQGDAFFMYADVSDVDICNVRMEGVQSSSGGLAVYPHSATAGTGIVIRNSQFYNYTFSAIFGGAPGLVIDGNYFENNGLPATPQNHTVYLTGNARNTGMRFTNNDTYVDAGCGGVILVFHQELPNLVVDNNRVTSPSTNVNCFGIQSSFSAYTDPAHFLNGKFRRNRLFMNGTRMEIKGCDGDCEITDNIISGGNLDIGTGSCNQAAGGGGVWCTHNAKIQNNTVYNGSLNIGGSSSGAMVENNAVTGSCNIGGTTTRNSNNVCNVNASSAWVNAAGANFTPANPGPLIGTASQTFFSPAAIGSASWSPSDLGVPRTPPIDAGATQN